MSALRTPTVPNSLYLWVMPVDRDRYRALSGAFPTGVTIATTVDATGAPKGLTTQSFIGLSTEPPLMLVSVNKTSRTLSALRHTQKFVINFLKLGSEEISTLFASKAEDKFRGLRWDASSIAGGAPILLDHVVAFAECVVVQTIEAGDHFIFVASVEGGEILGGIPLMYYHRAYAPWPEERPAPPVG